MDTVVKAILVLMVAFLLQYAWQVYRAFYSAEQILEDVDVNDDLITHSNEFGQPEIIEVMKGLHVAIGYSLANSIMLSGPDGLIIVDTTESLGSAIAIYKAFREIEPHKPIRAIMYTHNHADHTFGAKVFMQNEKDKPDIWAYHTLPSEISRLALTGPTVYRRAMRQFGTMLPEMTNAGLGPRLHYDPTSNGFLAPNKFLEKDEMDVEIAGIKMKLLHIPGETDDHMGIWIPDRKIFLSGDDIYKAFPNLYAIRGTPARDNMQWVNSLDIIRKLQPEYLIPSHTRPVIGKNKVNEVVTIYRDAIQFVHDQTVRYMNKGLHPTEIAELVKLPPHMAEYPHLLPLYGTVEWSVKGVFDRYLGWFSGDPVELSPLTPTEKAKRMISLGGGEEAVLKEANAALKDKDFKWALQLSSYVFLLDRDNFAAREARLKALKALAKQQTSANGRNYYLTYALEDHDIVHLKMNKGPMIFRISLKQIFHAVSARLKVEICGEIDMKGMFNFTDVSEVYLLHMRNGIIEIQQVMKDPGPVKFKATTTSHLWKEVAAQIKSPLWAYLTGEFILEGSFSDFKTFMVDCIDQDM